MKLNFPIRKLLVLRLQDLRGDDFIEAFFKYYSYESSVQPSFRMAKDHYEKRVNLYYDGFFRFLNAFEDELLQVVATTSQYGINTYFFGLKEILTFFINESTDQLLDKLNDYNEREYQKYLVEIEPEFIKFEENRQTNISTNNYKHLDKYETLEWRGILALYGGRAEKVTKTYYDYFCIEEGPDVIDLAYAGNYVAFIKSITEELRKVAQKHITLYEEGKYPSSHSVIMNNPQFLLPASALPEETSSKLLTAGTSSNSKLKWNGTPQEFIEYFYPQLFKRKIYLTKTSRADRDPTVKLLHQFFEIKKENSEEEISVKSLQTYFKDHASRVKEKESEKSTI